MDEAAAVEETASTSASTINAFRGSASASASNTIRGSASASRSRNASANASGSNAVSAGASSSANASNTTIRQVEADEAGDHDGGAFILLIMRMNWW